MIDSSFSMSITYEFTYSQLLEINKQLSDVSKNAKKKITNFYKNKSFSVP